MNNNSNQSKNLDPGLAFLSGFLFYLFIYWVGGHEFVRGPELYHAISYAALSGILTVLIACLINAFRMWRK